MIKKKTDDAVSITTGYIINVGVATIAISIFLFLLQGVFTDITGTASETRMRIVGEDLAGEIESVDRLAQRKSGTEPSSVITLPSFDRGYTVTVTAEDGDGILRLQTGGTNIAVGYGNESKVRGASDGIELSGGAEVTIRYDEGSDELVIE